MSQCHTPGGGGSAAGEGAERAVDHPPRVTGVAASPGEARGRGRGGRGGERVVPACGQDRTETGWRVPHRDGVNIDAGNAETQGTPGAAGGGGTGGGKGASDLAVP